jgi:hypothetical protein
MAVKNIDFSLLVPLALALSLAAPSRADAEEPPAQSPPAVAATAPPPAPAVAPAPPPPYSIPWQLRPVTVATALRSDTAVAFYDGAAGAGAGSTVATMLLGSYKLTPSFAPLVRLGFVQNSAPGTTPNGSSFVNPIVGATYSKKIAGSFRLAGFAAVTIPIGMGGGSAPDPATAAANSAGIAARSAMDNAMFAVNYTTGILGAGFAYVDHKLTVQAEATLFQLFRVKGNDMTGISSDATRTNSTMGLHAGYFVLPMLSLGGELRYQRWLSTPTRIAGGVRSDIPSANKDAVTFAVGPRFHFKLGDTWLRPGISYAQALDSPNSDAHYKVVQIDVPFVF